MDDVTTGVAIKVISTIILTILGFGVARGKKESRDNSWFNVLCRLSVVAGWVLFFFFAFYSFSWGIAEGLESEKFVIGVAYCFLGLCLYLGGKFILYVRGK